MPTKFPVVTHILGNTTQNNMITPNYNLRQENSSITDMTFRETFGCSRHVTTKLTVPEHICFSVYQALLTIGDTQSKLHNVLLNS